MKLKFWGYDEKNMGLHLISKSTTSGCTLGDANVIGIRAFEIIYFDGNIDENLSIGLHRYMGDNFYDCFHGKWKNTLK